MGQSIFFFEEFIHGFHVSSPFAFAAVLVSFRGSTVWASLALVVRVSRTANIAVVDVLEFEVFGVALVSWFTSSTVLTVLVPV